jgi:hypothetical protein
VTTRLISGFGSAKFNRQNSIVRSGTIERDRGFDRFVRSPLLNVRAGFAGSGRVSVCQNVWAEALSSAYGPRAHRCAALRTAGVIFSSLALLSPAKERPVPLPFE